VRHHDDLVEHFTAAAASHPDTVAVIVVGSVARGVERPDSDVDVYVVVTEEAFERARADQRLSYITTEGVGYEGGYVDVKVASLDYLRQAVASADEPARASFVGARVVWSQDDDVEHLVGQIPVVAPEVRLALVRSFVAQARLHAFYFLRHGYDHDDPVLLHHAATHLVLAVGRALLAHNGQLFQGPKYLLRSVEALPSKPDGIGDLLRAAVADPSPATAEALLVAFEAFHDWQVGHEETLSMFVEDNELAWLTGVPAPELR
jgi:predicted nucleotidyltransferase